MLLMNLCIPGKLPSLNEYISTCRSSPQGGGKMKHDNQEYVAWHIRKQIKGITIKDPVIMVYRWYEPNRKRDLDNISSYGRKVIQDALVMCNVLTNDGWKYVKGFRDEFYTDGKRPRIEVELWSIYTGETGMNRIAR